MSSHLDGTVPQDVDIVTLLAKAQDPLAELKDFHLHEVDYFLDRFLVQFSKIWNIFNELAALVHVFILVVLHVRV
jgi:hypothetical protein